MNGTRSPSPFIWHGHLTPSQNWDILLDRTDVRGNDLVRNVCKGVRAGDYFAILSSRQTGKTTFLHQVAYALKEEEARIRPIIIECSVSGDWEKPRAEFYKSMATKINQNVAGKSRDIPDNEASFREFLRNIAKKESFRPLLMLDEAEEVPGEILRPFFGILRTMWRKGISCILVGSEHLRWVETVVDVSPLFNIVHERRLADFSQEDVQKWAKRIERQHNIYFEAEAVDTLYEYGSGHPYLTQKICGLAYERSDGTITREGLHDSVEAILADDRHLLQMLQEAREDEGARASLTNILEEREVRFRPNSASVARLLGAGAIVNRDGYCRIRNKLYERALEDEAEAQDADVRIITRPVIVDANGNGKIPVCVANGGPGHIWLRGVDVIPGDSAAIEEVEIANPWMPLRNGEQLCEDFAFSDLLDLHVRAVYRQSSGRNDSTERFICPIFDPDESRPLETFAPILMELQFDDYWLRDMINLSFATYTSHDKKKTRLKSLDDSLPDEVFKDLSNHYLSDKAEGTFGTLLKVIPAYEEFVGRSIPRPKRYQDLFAHSLRVAYLGEYLLRCRNSEGEELIDLLCQYGNPRFKQQSVAVRKSQRDRILKTWWIAAIFHDVGHPLADALAGETGRDNFARVMDILRLKFSYDDRENQSERVIKSVTGELGVEKMKLYIEDSSHGAIGAYLLMRYCLSLSQPVEALPFDLRAAAQAILLHDLKVGSSIRLTEFPLATFLIMVSHAQMWGRLVVKREDYYRLSLVRELDHIKIRGLSLGNNGLQTQENIVFCHLNYERGRVADTGFDFEELCREKKALLNRVLIDDPGFPRFVFRIEYLDSTRTLDLPITTSANYSEGHRVLGDIRDLISHLSAGKAEERSNWLASIGDVLQKGSEEDRIECVSIFRDIFDGLTEEERAKGTQTLLNILEADPPSSLARRILSFVGGYFAQLSSAEQKKVFELLLEPVSDDPEVEGTRLRAAASVMSKIEDEAERRAIFGLLLSILISDVEKKSRREDAAEALVDYATLTEEQKEQLDIKAEQLYKAGDLKGNRYLGNYLAARDLAKKIMK